MHSPEATGKEEHDSHTFKGVHLPCPSMSADNPSPGHRAQEVKEHTAELNQSGGRLSAITLGEYVYGFYCYAVYSYTIRRNKGDVSQDNIPRDSK